MVAVNCFKAFIIIIIFFLLHCIRSYSILTAFCIQHAVYQFVMQGPWTTRNMLMPMTLTH